jgi:protein SCO1/2
MLIRDDGARVALSDELADARPVYLNFVYTSCTTVCPIMSQIFSALQDRLGTDRDRVRLISVSIDPEYDTPTRLTEYAHQFAAGPQWRFYTGTTEASTTVQKAFGVLTRDKMSHPVATFYRGAPGDPWIRFDGFASPEVLESEFHASHGG